MTHKLHMSGVITGSLNCFCMACDVFLKSPQDATVHVGTAEHQKKTNAVQFSDKFKDEHIKKFKWGYYCEFCNVLMPTASKVKLHVTEDKHKHNKGLLLLKPTGLDVVAFNNVLIEERAWHGLIEGVCELCNTEFEDENDHKTDPGHCLNMVLKPIQFGADNAIFRPLDDTAVQCLTCNKLLAPGRMSKHLDDTEHHEIYAKRRIQTNIVCQGSEANENCQEKVPVITSERNEFILEVRAGLYYCGYCHRVVSGCKLHLDSSDHRNNRTFWEGPMGRHLSGWQRHKMREQLASLAMIR